MPNKSPPPDEELERRSPSKDRDNETWAVGSGPEHGKNAEPGLRPEDVTEEEERRPPLPATEGEPSPGIDRTALGNWRPQPHSSTQKPPHGASRVKERWTLSSYTRVKTRFTCPGCQLSYPTHHSLVRHVGVSHKRMSLNITFKCNYAHASLLSTLLHYRHAHGIAVPPQQIDGSNEKRCPFCVTTFPSTRSCSTHIREKHMGEMCAQRAREAAQKAVQQGESTARTKWTQQEIERFKAAFTKHGPASNIPHWPMGRNWRPISLQLTSYKLYTAIIARRVASWAAVTSLFSVSQKGFLVYDGCSEHNFLLRSMLTDSRRQMRNLLLTWLVIREAFPSVSHQLMLFMMKRLGLSGTLLRVVQDIYSGASMAVRTGKDSYTANIPRRGVKQGCPLSSSETLGTPSSEVWLCTSWQTQWLRGRGDWTRQSLKTCPNSSIQQPPQQVTSTACGVRLEPAWQTRVPF